ncbi:hypothetical protein DZD47_16365 [Mycobacterium tuberculosis]|uniref:hypothetical protein n=1 Tax=Mycobacterium tuberculosis TaxID=1773 RepID=UPI0011CCA007|nr:hypothetical protein [Mycobacterium tuberculosis]TXR93854.1 hypothetical protein DZD47_16365 [Mycobacterium tuberculosis]
MAATPGWAAERHGEGGQWVAGPTGAVPGRSAVGGNGDPRGMPAARAAPRGSQRKPATAAQPSKAAAPSAIGHRGRIGPLTAALPHPGQHSPGVESAA